MIEARRAHDGPGRLECRRLAAAERQDQRRREGVEPGVSGAVGGGDARESLLDRVDRLADRVHRRAELDDERLQLTRAVGRLRHLPAAGCIASRASRTVLTRPAGRPGQATDSAVQEGSQSSPISVSTGPCTSSRNTQNLGGYGRRGNRRGRCVAAEEDVDDQDPDERGRDPGDLQWELERVVDDAFTEVRGPVVSASAAAICVPLAGRKRTPMTAVHIAIM